MLKKHMCPDPVPMHAVCAKCQKIFSWLPGILQATKIIMFIIFLNYFLIKITNVSSWSMIIPFLD